MVVVDGGGESEDPTSSPWLIKRGARTQDTATAFAGYGGNRTPVLVRYKNESINRLVTFVLGQSAKPRGSA